MVKLFLITKKVQKRDFIWLWLRFDSIRNISGISFSIRFYCSRKILPIVCCIHPVWKKSLNDNSTCKNCMHLSPHCSLMHSCDFHYFCCFLKFSEIRLYRQNGQTENCTECFCDPLRWIDFIYVQWFWTFDVAFSPYRHSKLHGTTISQRSEN